MCQRYFQVSLVKWRTVWILSERWTIMPMGGGWLCQSCQNPQPVMIICQDLLCKKKKKLISSDSISVSVFLLTNIACHVSCVNTELIFFIKQHHVQSGRLIYPNMPNSVFSGGWCKMMWTLVDLFSLKLKTVDGCRWIFWCLRLLLNTTNSSMVHTLYRHTLCVQCTLF